MLITQIRLLVIDMVDKPVKVGREDDTPVEGSLVQSESGIYKNEIGFNGDFKSDTIEKLS
jgi:hypothetical protein